MQENRNDFENDGEIIIDTFPEVPNTVRGVKDGVELTFGNDPDEELGFEFETVAEPSDAKSKSPSKLDFELAFEEKKTEFAVPEKFSGEASETKEEPVAKINPAVRQTYVPKFTEASEKYRLGLYRPEADKPNKDRYTEVEDNSIDPTAEIDESVASEETAPQSDAFDTKTNTAKMFKFSFIDRTEDNACEPDLQKENTEQDSCACEEESLDSIDTETESDFDFDSLPIEEQEGQTLDAEVTEEMEVDEPDSTASDHGP